MCTKLNKKFQKLLIQKDDIDMENLIKMREDALEYRKKAEEEMLIIKKKFSSREYPIEVLEEQLARASTVARTDLLTVKEKEKDGNLPFTTIFNKTLPNIKYTIDKIWSFPPYNLHKFMV